MIDENLEIIIVSHRILVKYSIKLIDHLLIPLTCRSNVQTMETRKQQYFICTGCFNELVQFVMEHPKLVKILDLPEKITIHPMPTETSEKCERCEALAAVGYLGLAITEQVTA